MSAPGPSHAVLVHVIDGAAWERVLAVGEDYRPASLESVGFTHLSDPAVLPVALARHYPGVEGLVALVLDPGRLGDVRFEEGDPPEPGLVFPHLYGPLPLDAVVRVVPLEVGPDGTHHVPELG